MSNSPERETRGSAEAKAWAVDQSRRIGEAVQSWRKQRGLTMIELADRTSELGYPITRGTIAKIEGNHRVGKLDVAELSTLAAALDVPPVLLLYPDAPDGPVEALPGRTVSSEQTLMWFWGERGLPEPKRDDGVHVVVRTNEGIRLLDAVRERNEIRFSLFDFVKGIGGMQDSTIQEALQDALRATAAQRSELNTKIRELGGTVSDG